MEVLKYERTRELTKHNDKGRSGSRDMSHRMCRVRVGVEQSEVVMLDAVWRVVVDGLPSVETTEHEQERLSLVYHRLTRLP